MKPLRIAIFSDSVLPVRNGVSISIQLLVDRTHRELTDDEVKRIAKTYHAWRGEAEAGPYEDIPGFCYSAPTEEVKSHGFVLTPGRYVGAEAQAEDAEPFAEKMTRLTSQLSQQMQEAAKLDAAIKANLKSLGYEL